MPKIKFVEDLRGKHKNKRIWIVGTGPSLDDLPDDFFDDKISIALNWAIIPFPKCTYWHANHPEYILWMKENRPEVLKKSFLSYPLVPFNNPGHKKPRLTEEETLNLLGKYRDDPTYVRWHWILSNHARFMKFLPRTVNDIKAGRSCHYVCLGTVLHYAIQTAVILGSKKIVLVGCESKATAKANGDRIHAKSRGLSEFYPWKWNSSPRMRTQRSLDLYLARFKRIRLGVELLAKSFKSYGVEIQRYYYKSGYEPVI